jgi:7-cyano-7-deazaguanine synthase
MPQPHLLDHGGVAIVSGGLDSITMVHYLLAQGTKPHLLSFDYGQRHRKELEFARALAEKKGLPWSLIDLSSLTDLISTSALTSNPQRNMALTVVPNRNMMMMSIATAVCVSSKGYYIAAGMHSGDHAQYPDCRPSFTDAFWQAAITGNQGFMRSDFFVWTPFIMNTKDDIAQIAFDLNVQPADTWSCYKGGSRHCGRCGTCVERLEAINSVGKPDWDQTEYEDPDFWKTAVAEYQGSKNA